MTVLPVSESHWLELAHTASYRSELLAKLCGISLRHLERVFLVRFGQSPKMWLDEKRIERAQSLITAGCSIKEIAAQLGYKRIGHFCRQFKQFKLLRPSQFRVLTVALQFCRPRTTNGESG